MKDVMMGDLEHTRRWEGQLNKFTNVVKGWQYRWFVLDPSAGVLEYYLLEDRSGKCRGSQQMSGAVVSPSQEDENTFLINFISGEHYKVRASSAKERQIWVDRLRHCVSHLESASSRPVSGAGPAGDCLPDGGGRGGSLPLSSMDTFGSVQDALQNVFSKQEDITKIIESLPVPKPYDTTSPSSHNEKLLMIKANSHALVTCLQTSLDLIQQVREQQIWGTS